MTKIIRTPTRAAGGITSAERTAMAQIARDWIENAFRCDPADPDRVRDAVVRLYAAAGLPAPRVVLVDSPVVMAFAYGAAAAIWHRRADATHDAIYAATSAATRVATDAATRAAAYAATSAATSAATDAATSAATSAAAQACRDVAGDLGLHCANRWWRVVQGGSNWSGAAAYIAACRDVLQLDLPEFKVYQPWGDLAREAGYRVLHPQFAIVCNRPAKRIPVDADHRPHCEDGPTHLWRDGVAWYHWHGIRVPDHWIEQRDTLDPAEVLRADNVEQRAAGAAIIGWARMAPALSQRIIDGDPASDMGALVELTLPGLPEPGRFLRAVCPRNGAICEGVPRVSDIDGRPIETVIAAQAWRIGDPVSEYIHPPART